MIVNILYIDDDHDDYEVFSDVVKEINTNAIITFLNDSSEIEKYLVAPLPDIIFIDYNMPLMNGIECLKKIREKKECDHIPVIFYSVFDDKARQAYQNGANYFIVKQISAENTKN